METQKLLWQNWCKRGSRVGWTTMLALALWLVGVSSGRAQDLVWAKRAGGIGTLDTGYGIAVDRSGNSYATGFFSGPATFGPGEAHETVLTTGGVRRHLCRQVRGGCNLWQRRHQGGTGCPYEEPLFFCPVSLGLQRLARNCATV